MKIRVKLTIKCRNNSAKRERETQSIREREKKRDF